MDIYRHIVERYLTPDQTPPRKRYAAKIGFVLAVSGAAASGKTMFCGQMADYLRKHGVSAEHVPLDGYLLDRKTRDQRGLSGYDPQSSDLPHMIAQMKTEQLIHSPKEAPFSVEGARRDKKQKPIR